MSETYTILVQLQADLTPPDQVKITELERAAVEVLRMEKARDDSMISIIVSTSEHIQDLNKQYRQVDAPTDVLSFPAEKMPAEIDEDQGYLGDIILGLPYIAKRAIEEKRSIHDDLALMVVHGTLHLLGYDHDTQEKQEKMWAVQAQALKALGINIEVPAYIHE